MYEREAKKLRYKLDETRRQQRHERSSSEKECSNKTGASRQNISCEKRRNTSDSSTANSITRRSVEKPLNQEDILNFGTVFNEDIYDEVQDNATSENALAIDVKNIYDVPKESTKVDANNSVKEIAPNPSVSLEDNIIEKKSLEVMKETSDDNKSVKDDNQNTEESGSNHAIYATVNLEMKKNSKRQKDCSNNLIVAII